MCIVIVLLL